MEDFASGLRLCLAGIMSLSPEQEQALQKHFELLTVWNQRMNLTSVEGLEETVERHFAESILLASKLPAPATTLVDIGSGAGFPGLPVAIARPEYRVTLVDSNSRKCVFLREASRSLQNVTVAECRAEDLKGRFDWLVSRGVRWQQLLPLLPGLSCQFAFLLGEDDANEMLRQPSVACVKAVRLPWGKRRVLVMGEVSRGTGGCRDSMS